MKTDVLIIGGGLTGIMAADTIIQNSDLSVLLLQTGSGASPYIHAFCMPVGPGDSEELFLEDTLRSGYGQSDPTLANKLCGGSLKLLEDLQAMGCDLDRQGENYRLLQALGSSVPRIASIRNSTGPSMLSRLRKRLKESERYRELSGYRAVSLLTQQGAVAGCRCYCREEDCFVNISAGVTVLASGGFGRLFPESTNSADIGGDGIAMAYLAGAGLTDMEFIQFEPSAAVWPEQVAGKGIVTTMFYDGAVLRGADGRRFMLENSEKGECVPKDVQSKCIYREIQEHGATPHGGVWFDATGVPEEKWQGSYKPYLERYLACGIDLRKEPVEIAPAAHTTCGGVRIDENCRTGIPGLIACGEVAGGLHGANRLGGNAGLETMVFGRIAGETAIADACCRAEIPDERTENRQPDVDIAAMRQQLQQVLRSCMNVIRDKDGLAQGLETLSSLLNRLGDYRDCYEKQRLYNDLLTAKIAMLSAAQRRGSVGCHCRADEVEETPYRVIIKQQAGEMTALRCSI